MFLPSQGCTSTIINVNDITLFVDLLFPTAQFRRLRLHQKKDIHPHTVSKHSHHSHYTWSNIPRAVLSSYKINYRPGRTTSSLADNSPEPPQGKSPPTTQSPQHNHHNASSLIPPPHRPAAPSHPCLRFHAPNNRLGLHHPNLGDLHANRHVQRTHHHSAHGVRPNDNVNINQFQRDIWGR